MKLWMTIIMALFFATACAQTEKIAYITRADLCMDCSEQQLAKMALKLSPDNTFVMTENYVFLVDPVRQNYKKITTTIIGQQKSVKDISVMAAKEQKTFAPLMRYGQSIQALKQAIAEIQPETLLNDGSCDTALDSYSNASCQGALRKAVLKEVEKNKH